MFFSFLFSFCLCEDKFAEFCIYSTNQKKCSNYENSFSKTEYSSKIEDLAEETNKFDGYNATTLYIAEDISDTNIDIYYLKNSKNIRLIGLDEKTQFGLLLNIQKVATLDGVEIRNCHCIKDDTTQFYITTLVLSNVNFTGFEKASCFYGETLDIDFLSPANTTFKFEKIIYHCNYSKPFYPNYDVDGAIFAQQVTFLDFLDGSSIYQYGDQFIITPVSIDYGFRRTNFRQSTSNNITYLIEHNQTGYSLEVGSWFANRAASFSNMKIDVKNSNLYIQGTRWHGFETLSMLLDNAIVHINDTHPRIDILKDSKNSIVHIDVEDYDFDDINSDNLSNISFIGDKMSIKTLTLNPKKGVNFNATLTEIQTVTSTQTDTEADITGSSVIIHSISNQIKHITVESLILDSLLSFEIGTNSIPQITCDYASLVENVEKCQFNLTRSHDTAFPSFTQDYITLLTANQVSNTFKIDEIIDDNDFPIKMTQKDSSYGFNSADTTQRTHLYCVSDDGSSACGYEEGEIVKTTSTSLLSMLESSGIPKDHYNILHINIDLDTETQFQIDTDVEFESLSIWGYREGCSVLNSYPENVKFLQVRNVSIEFDKSNTEPSVYYFQAFNCNLSDFMKNQLNYSSFSTAYFDNETYSQISDMSFPPHHLKIECEEIEFMEEWISPVVPCFITDRKITITNVNKVSGHNGFQKNLTLYIEPQDSINFTTNSYDNISFKITSDKTVDVYFKAVLPTDCFGKSPNSKYILHPNFFGSEINSEYKFCAQFLNITLQDKEYIQLGDESLYCGGYSNPYVKTEVSMSCPYVKGIVTMEKLKIERQLYLDNDTYFEVNEFANPDDDFLVYFNWTLDRMPLMKVHRYSNAHVSTFTPSMQAYVYPSLDDDFIHNNSRIFNMGIPFLCIEDSDFKGNLFNRGLIFKLQDFDVRVSTIFNRIGEEKDTDVCAYVIPYTPEIIEKPQKGPKNRLPWVIILVISIVLLLALVISILIPIIRLFKK